MHPLSRPARRKTKCYMYLPDGRRSFHASDLIWTFARKRKVFFWRDGKRCEYTREYVCYSELDIKIMWRKHIAALRYARDEKLQKSFLSHDRLENT